MKREKEIKIRLSDAEFQHLNELKTTEQLAVWIRETCLSKKTKRRSAPPVVDPFLLRHLAAIGNNVNQIARQCNKHLSPLDSLDVILRLDAIEQVLKKLRDDHAIKNI